MDGSKRIFEDLAMKHGFWDRTDAHDLFWYLFDNGELVEYGSVYRWRK